MTAAVAPHAERLIRVWLGDQVIVRHREPDPDEAKKYAEGMGRRYSVCRVTNDPYVEPADDSPPGP